MKKGLLSLCFLFQFYVYSFSLNPGDIMFVAFDADVADGFAIVALVSIPNSTTINFFDDDGVGQIDWTTTSTVAAGTVVIFQSVQNSSFSVNIGNIARTTGFSLTGSNEAIVAKEGMTCLAAIRNDAGTAISSGCNGLSTDYIVSSALLDEDVMVYDGPTVCNGTLAACQAMIVDNNNWTTEDGTGDQSQDANVPDVPDDITGNFSGSALPAELISFEVNVKNNEPILTWQTASEINNSHFEIEHSATGQDFKTIGEVDGNGTTFEIQNYSFIHKTPTSGINYYRLKQVDFDGNFEYSNTVSTFVKQEDNWNLRPTQSREEIIVNWSDDFSAKAVSVYDLNGKLVFDRKLDFDTEQLNIETSNLPVGTYILKMQTDRAISSKRFFKIR